MTESYEPTQQDPVGVAEQAVPTVTNPVSEETITPQPEIVAEGVYRGMLTETVDNYIGKVLTDLKLDRTSANLDKISMNLITKIDSWLTMGEWSLSEVNDQQLADKFFAEACQRRGMPDTADNWKKIIEGWRH